METKLFSELSYLYLSKKRNPTLIKIRIRLRDLIDPACLRKAVNMVMARYPYFCVELQKKEEEFVFKKNDKEIPVINSLNSIDLNSEDSNYHMLAFFWEKNWIGMDVFHGLTDGTGAYEVIRTLLYYYCSEKYSLKLNGEGIRLPGDEITLDEWTNPVEKIKEMPAPSSHEQPANALNLIEVGNLENDNMTNYNVVLSESEFMKFNREYKGTPGTMVSLLLSRAISKIYPESKHPIRVALCVNQRKALKSPKAHQSLVGGVILEYNEKLKKLSLLEQEEAFRKIVTDQTTDSAVLAGVCRQRKINEYILNTHSDSERLAIVDHIDKMAASMLSATVSYVGKADFKEAEKYIRDFRLISNMRGKTTLVEISAVNGRFTLDFVQPFSSPIYVNGFLKELDLFGINYDLQDVNEIKMPDICLPWVDKC